MQRLVELMSLAMTPGTVIASLIVAMVWSREIRLDGSKLRANDWFILGVVISFAGQIMDNLYWGIAWHHHFIGNVDTAKRWFKSGVFSNLPFRQTTGFIAALCHLQAAWAFSKERKNLCIASPKVVGWASLAIAFVYALLLILIA